MTDYRQDLAEMLARCVGDELICSDYTSDHTDLPRVLRAFHNAVALARGFCPYDQKTFAGLVQQCWDESAADGKD